MEAILSAENEQEMSAWGGVHASAAAHAFAAAGVAAAR
jgi:hypothetical protein